MKLTAQQNERGFAPLIAIIAITVIAGGTIATTVAAQESIPGDTLYSVKEITDEIRVATQFSEEGKINTHLVIANEKTQELEKLEAQGASPEHIATAIKHLGKHHAIVEEHTARTHTHSKEHLPQNAHSQLQYHQDILNDVLIKAPEHTKEAIQHAIEASKHHGATPTPSHDTEVNNQNHSQVENPSVEHNTTPSPSAH